MKNIDTAAIRARCKKLRREIPDGVYVETYLADVEPLLDAYEALEAENAQLREVKDALESDMINSTMNLSLMTEEVARLREEARWIPITERPPKSGAHVLLLCETNPSKNTYVCDGYYAAPKEIVGGCDAECDTEYDDETDEFYLLEGYYEVIKNWDDFGSVVIGDIVTHWRPLPAAPDKEE